MNDMEPQQNLIPQGETDHEGAMAKADLYKLANYSVKLFKKMDDNAQLEAWVQAKITKAADYIASVYHYLEYELEFSNYGSKLENAGIYNEEQKLELKNKLIEAKEKIAELKKIQAQKLEEGKSPKAKKDWDKDGKIESEKDEVIGSRRKAAGLDESWDDDDEDPDVKKADSELKKKGVKLPKVKVDPDKDMSKLAKKSKKEDDLDESWDEADDEDPDVKKADSELKKRGVKLPKVKHKEVPVKKTKQDREEELDEVYGQSVYESYDDDDEDPDVKKADSELKKRGVKLPNVKHKEVPVKKTAKDKEEELDEGGVRSTARRVVTRAISNDPDIKKALGKEGVKQNKQISRDEHKKSSDEDLQKVVDRNRKSKEVSEASKPDFLDLDKDGNKKEPMKKAAKDKTCKESVVSTAIKRAKKIEESEKDPDRSPSPRVHGKAASVVDRKDSGDDKHWWDDDPDAVRAGDELKKMGKGWSPVSKRPKTEKPNEKQTVKESAELNRMKEFLTRLNG